MKANESASESLFRKMQINPKGDFRSQFAAVWRWNNYWSTLSKLFVVIVQVTGGVVEMDGDEMTRIIWAEIKDKVRTNMSRYIMCKSVYRTSSHISIHRPYIHSLFSRTSMLSLNIMISALLTEMLPTIRYVILAGCIFNCNIRLCLYCWYTKLHFR